MTFYYRVVNHYWFEAEGLVQCGLMGCEKGGEPTPGLEREFFAVKVTPHHAKGRLAVGNVVRVTLEEADE